MEYRRLGLTDMNVSIIGLGTCVFGNFYKDSTFNYTSESFEKAKNIVDTALYLGINYFDSAPWYGNAENLLANGLKGHDRYSYYLATKVGRYNNDKEPKDWFDFSYKRTLESVEESLKIFDCEYIDLVQVHDFEFASDLTQIVNETLPALADLKKIGKIKYIGINSYLIEKLKELIEISSVKIDTVLTFSHLNLDDTSLLDHIEYFREKQVGIINAAPLYMGLYTEAGPPSWHPAPEKLKQTVILASDYCKSKNVDITKLAIHFSATNSLIDTTLISMSSQELVEKNFNSLKELSKNEELVLQEIRNKFFIPLNYKGYGDADVLKYQSKMKKNNI